LAGMLDLTESSRCKGDPAYVQIQCRYVGPTRARSSPAARHGAQLVCGSLCELIHSCVRAGQPVPDDVLKRLQATSLKVQAAKLTTKLYRRD
jgi:hypothetical protein